MARGGSPLTSRPAVYDKEGFREFNGNIYEESPKDAAFNVKRENTIILKHFYVDIGLIREEHVNNSIGVS